MNMDFPAGDTTPSPSPNEAVIEELRALRRVVEHLAKTIAIAVEGDAPISAEMRAETIAHCPIGSSVPVEIRAREKSSAVKLTQTSGQSPDWRHLEFGLPAATLHQPVPEIEKAQLFPPPHVPASENAESE